MANKSQADYQKSRLRSRCYYQASLLASFSLWWYSIAHRMLRGSKLSVASCREAIEEAIAIYLLEKRCKSNSEVNADVGLGLLTVNRSMLLVPNE